MNTDVGIFANENAAPNNSAIISNRNNQIGTIYCNSGSHASNIGKWFDPYGSEITQTSGGSLTTVHGGGDFPAYVGLQLKPGAVITENDEGVYTCIIPDENNIDHTLYVGVYRFGFTGMFN